VDLRAATSGTTADDAPEEAGANDSLAAPPPSSRAGAAAGEREAPLAQEPRARGVVRCCDADGRETAETVELPLDGWGMDFQWRAPPPVSAVSEARGSAEGGGSEKGGGSAEEDGSAEGSSSVEVEESQVRPSRFARLITWVFYPPAIPAFPPLLPGAKTAFGVPTPPRWVQPTVVGPTPLCLSLSVLLNVRSL
jgi:hypothetical protein